MLPNCGLPEWLGSGQYIDIILISLYETRYRLGYGILLYRDTKMLSFLGFKHLCLFLYFQNLTFQKYLKADLQPHNALRCEPDINVTI